MKISFISGYFNHHQKPLSEALWRLTDKNYTFFPTTEMSDERRKLGYSDESPEYVKHISEADILASDVIIGGVNLPEHIKNSIDKNTVYFRYSERLFKKGKELLKYPARFFRQRAALPKKPTSYLLCASAYVAADMRSFGLFRGRAYKWGYFPETRYYSDPDALFAAKDRKEILWCGRFLDWKHPTDVIDAAKRLLDDGFDFTLKFIGTGPEEDNLRRKVSESGLSDRVTFLGTSSPDEVRDEMEKAGIFVFTSDFNEGWGAVLNEAMNSGCAVVASHAAGSTPYLLENGKNGYVYRSGDISGLYKNLKSLLSDGNLQSAFGKAAYEKIVGKWNSEVAAERLIRLSEAISKGENTDIYADGPCSKAEILKNDWF